MEVTAKDIARIPLRNLRVPLDEFVVVWVAAERQNADGHRVPTGSAAS
jgi:hypothetical protein